MEYKIRNGQGPGAHLTGEKKMGMHRGVVQVLTNSKINEVQGYGCEAAVLEESSAKSMYTGRDGKDCYGYDGKVYKTNPKEDKEVSQR